MSPRHQQQDPAALEAEVRNDVDAIAREASNLAERASFAQALQQLNERYAQLQPLSDHLTRLRTRGFVWWPNLEQELAEARRIADNALRSAQAEAQRSSQQLRAQADNVARRAQGFLGQHRLAHQIPAIDALDAERERVAAQITSAEQRIAAQAEPFTKLVDKLKGGVDGSHWTMDQFDAASFRPRAEENPLQVAAAKWEDSPYGAIEGRFFLTDLVVRFEKDMGGSRKVELEKPVGAITASDDSERGWFFKDEVLTLQFRSGDGGPARATLVFKNADSKGIDEFIERVRSGQLDVWKVRRPAPGAAGGAAGGAVPLAASAAIPVRWPSQCLNCGAPITAPVRGQTEVVCEFCRSRFPVELQS